MAQGCTRPCNTIRARTRSKRSGTAIRKVRVCEAYGPNLIFWRTPVRANSTPCYRILSSLIHTATVGYFVRYSREIGKGTYSTPMEMSSGQMTRRSLVRRFTLMTFTSNVGCTAWIATSARIHTATEISTTNRERRLKSHAKTVTVPFARKRHFLHQVQLQHSPLVQPLIDERVRINHFWARS